MEKKNATMQKVSMELFFENFIFNLGAKEIVIGVVAIVIGAIARTVWTKIIDEINKKIEKKDFVNLPAEFQEKIEKYNYNLVQKLDIKITMIEKSISFYVSEKSFNGRYKIIEVMINSLLNKCKNVIYESIIFSASNPEKGLKEKLDSFIEEIIKSKKKFETIEFSNEQKVLLNNFFTFVEMLVYSWSFILRALMNIKDMSYMEKLKIILGMLDDNFDVDLLNKIMSQEFETTVKESSKSQFPLKEKLN